MRKTGSFLLLVAFLAASQVFYLSKGTKVIAIEDPSYPLVSAVIMIKAGAAYEQPEEKGLSHFLEHMLFDGTIKRSRDQLENSFANLGTYYNAFTRKDYVAFELTALPENFLPSLQLLCEMIFDSLFEEKEFEKEKGVVYQEIVKDSLNPRTSTAYLFYESFLFNSPYASPVLGYSRIIKNLKKEKVLAFWKKLYAPNRMSLIIVGNFKIEEIRKELNHLFDRQPSNYVFKDFSVKPIWGKVLVAASNLRRIDIALKSPSLLSEDAPAFELLAKLLEKDLKKAFPSPFAMGQYEKFRNFSFLHFTLFPVRSLPAEAVERTLKELIRKRLREGFYEEEVKTLKKQIINQRLFFNDKFLHKARQIAEWEAKASYERMKIFYRDLQQLTAKDVYEAFKKTYGRDIKFFVLIQQPGKKSSFQIKKAETREGKLKNGLRFAFRPVKSPVFALHLLAGKRASMEFKPGLAHILFKILEKKFEGLTEKYAIQAQFTDMTFLSFDDFYLSKDFSYIRIEATSDQKEAAKEIIYRSITEPIGKEDFLKARKDALRNLAFLNSRACWVAKQLLEMKLLPSPLSAPIYGTATSLKTINYEDVENFRKAFLSPSNLVLTWVGEANPEKFLEDFKNLKNHSFQLPKEKFNYSPTRIRGACLTGGWMLRLSEKNQLKKTYPQFLVLASLLKDILAERIREKEGLAYTISVDVKPFRNLNYMVFSVATTPDKLKRVIKIAEESIAKLPTMKLSDKFLYRIKMTAAAKVLRYGERKINQAFYMGWYYYLGLGSSYLWELPQKIMEVSQKDLIELVKKISGPVYCALPSMRHP